MAYKVLLERRAAHAQYRSRFVREARLTAQLEHPNIVPVYDLGVDENGRIFFAMKRVHDRPLQEVLHSLRLEDPKTLKEMTLPRLLSALGQICQATHYAHTRVVLHRDLKPANIMVGAYGEVLGMDWGLSKRISALGESPIVEEQTSPEPETILMGIRDDITGRIDALLKDLPAQYELGDTLEAPGMSELQSPSDEQSRRLDQLVPGGTGGSPQHSEDSDALGIDGDSARDFPYAGPSPDRDPAPRWWPRSARTSSPPPREAAPARAEPTTCQYLVRADDGGLKLPVTAVSFHDAVAYAEWRGVRDGVRYRLPTDTWCDGRKTASGGWLPAV